jgi:phenylacetate-coenzyme A ligase PaaK-like adenylate-forming protein
LGYIQDFTSSLHRINEANFEDIALQLFRYQATNNRIYKHYVDSLGLDIVKIASINQIPFLPIEFFKTQDIVSGNWLPEVEFTSSGTSGLANSRHKVSDLSFYLTNAESIFNRFFGPLNNYHFLALLPSYLERNGSSLIAMMNHFIKKSESTLSGFYLGNEEELATKFNELVSSTKKVIIWGVSFALLDLAERFQLDLSNCLIVETGGMKGRRKEMIREELHHFLTNRFNVRAIASEYGMTELLSQAYSLGEGKFVGPPWVKILIREVNDPFVSAHFDKVGGINVIDLANAHSCAFIETQDLGKMSQSGYFEVVGRIDNSDLRGCNLMVN